ncbi:MAG: DegT/DnrJ/EryC1/StrS family aminotransferase [Bacteroidales bacterium]|nr:DegT/DnrJ/EryC1/StrS family aminotransferase [Bacteroidales bacterium]
MIPFSPPRIDEKIIEAVVEVLRSGWITTGPKTYAFEEKLQKYTEAQKVVCVGSATAGLELVLRWFGIGRGDEVIVPAYTYAASANVILHCGARPVFIDSSPEDYNLDIETLEKLITERTKAIIPVDIGGFPCDYDRIYEIVTSSLIQQKFQPATDKQRQLGRILILSDAAHSLGAIYKGRKTGTLADFTVFSFHAVKNLTTAEGGAISIQLPENFDVDQVYRELKLLSLHGQDKDAMTKLKPGNWEYDILLPGYKYNMTDIQAAMGLIELERYDSDMLSKRKYIFKTYDELLEGQGSIKLPLYKDHFRETSYHLYQIQISFADEKIRNEIIQQIFQKGVSVNVHFKPLPLMTAYHQLGYRIDDYPHAYEHYKKEITLPVYYQLTDDQIYTIAKVVRETVEQYEKIF